MKQNLILIWIALLFACNAGDHSESLDESNGVQQWLTMDGESDMPHIVMVSGDEEYRSEEALPQLAKILSERHGFNCTVLFAQDPEVPGIVDPNYLHNIPGLGKLEDADMMLIFTRFRALIDEQMAQIEEFLMSGKPVLGIRTSTHAFHFRDVDSTSSYQHYGNFYSGDDEWKDGFGRLVLGEKWINHHGHHAHQSTRGIAAEGASGHEILNGIEDGDIWGPTDVYGVRLPLPGDAQPIVLGQVMDREGEFDEDDVTLGMKASDHKLADPVMRKNRDGQEVEVDLNDPLMPIAWTKSYQIPGGQRGKAFASTIGASTDLLAEGTRRMMVNAVFWCLDMEVPSKANVDLVGSYEVTRFAFHDDAYWDNKNLEVSSLK